MPPFIKFVDPGAYDWGPDPAVVKVSAGGLVGADLSAFVKRAGHGLADQIRRLEKRAGEELVHMIAVGATEAFGCFVPDTPVRMADGSARRIADVAVGDAVVDRRGRPAAVTTVYRKNWDGPGVSLDVSGLLDRIECTADHRFYVIPGNQVRCAVDGSKHCKPGTVQQLSVCASRKCPRSVVSYDPVWVEAGSIRPGDYVLCPAPDRGVGDQTWAWSVPLARVIGYFLAEGSFIKSGAKRTGMSICFGAAEANTLGVDLTAQVGSLAADYGGTHVRGPYTTVPSTAVYHVTGEALANRVFKAVGEYSRQKRLTGEVISQPPDRIAHMLATYLDGDGTCPVYRRPDSGGEEARYTIGTASRRLADDVQWLLTRLGVCATVCESKTHAEKSDLDPESRFYHVSFTNKDGAFLAGRAVKWRNVEAAQIKQWSFPWNGYVCRPVRSVDRFHLTGEVCDLEVDGDHTYTVGNGVAVHNSNRNGDGFTARACREYHPTFVKHARPYRDHKNKDPRAAYGVVKLSHFNEDMKRIELVVAYNATKAAAARNGGLVADKELEKLSSNRQMAVSMACVTDPDAPVLTTAGYRRIADVSAGDTVYTHAGNWRRVTGVNRRVYTGDVVDVHLEGLPVPLRLTADHPMYAKVLAGYRPLVGGQRPVARWAAEVAAGRPGFDWVPAGDLGRDDRVEVRPVAAVPGVAAVDDVRLAELLGLYVAEGSIGYKAGRPNTLTYTVNSADWAVAGVPRLVESLWPGVAVRLRPKANSKVSMSVDVHSADLAAWMVKLVGVRADGKVVPMEMFGASPECRLAFLGRWLDGDGFCDLKGAHWSTCSLPLALQCRDLLLSVGVASSVYKIDHAKCATSGYSGSGLEYTVNVSNFDIGVLAAYSAKAASSPFAKTGTRAKPPCLYRVGDVYAYRVKDVVRTAVTAVQTYNFEVEGDHSYSLLGTSSHNCRVGYDTCSGCGNRARSRDEYCTGVSEGGTCKYGGLKSRITKVAEDGHVLHADNPHPTFFDISHVFRPADRTAYVLGRVKEAAAAGRPPCGAEIAAAWGSPYGPDVHTLGMAKAAADQVRLLYTLASAEAAAAPAGVDRAYDPRLAAAGPFEKAAAAPPAGVPLPDRLRALADAGVVLPVGEFVRAAARDGVFPADAEKAAAAARHHLPGAFSDLLADPDLEQVLLANPYTPPVRPAAPAAAAWARAKAAAYAATPAALRDRVFAQSLRFPDPPPARAVKAAGDDGREVARRCALYQLAALAAPAFAADRPGACAAVVRMNLVAN